MPPSDEKHRAPLLWLLAPYLAGLALGAAGARAGGIAGLIAAAVLAGGAVVVLALRPRREQAFWAAAIAGAACLVGMTRMQEALDNDAVARHWAGLPAREATLEVAIQRVFPARAGAERVSGIGTILGSQPRLPALTGRRIAFAASTSGRLLPTSHVVMRGVLQALDRDTVAPGSFAAYLLTSGIHFQITRAETERVTRPPRAAARFIGAVGDRCEAILRHGLPAGHPGAAVYLAMFLGRKSELSDAQKEGFLRSGTMHLFAISGLHIAVIAACLHALLSVVRVPPRLGAVLGLAALAVFVEATGGTPSAHRALLMVAFVWAGHALRLPANPVASLVGSAFLVLAWDPTALLSTSFQFSYAVVAALLLYGLPLRNRWQAQWSRLVTWRDLPEADWRPWQRGIFHLGRGALTAAAISWSATLISTPLSLAYFGLASPGAVLSNLTLVPLTSGAISAGVGSILCGLPGLTPLSTLFNHAGALILVVVDAGARAAAGLPGMFFEGGFTQGWMAPAIVLALLACFIAGYARGWDRFPGRWFTPPAVLLAALVFLVTPGPPGQQSAGMKSAYELAMERLRQSDPDAGAPLTAEQKARLAELDRIYQGRIAEREIFLNQRLAEAAAGGQGEEVEKIRTQIKHERARLEEEREDEKNRVRRNPGAKA